MSSTTSNYISKINQNYPSPGVDNDSQGFRDNFKNISLALDFADTDITELQLNSVRLNQTNNFGQNLIKQAQFQDCSVYVYDDTAVNVTGDVTLDYKNGSYQKISLAAGEHNITITNWPGDNKSGALTLAVTTSTTYATSVNFVDTNVVNLSSDALPVTLPSGSPVIFHINSDGTTGNLFVKKMNDRTLSATTVDIDSYYVTGTNITALESLRLGSNIYRTDETTSSYFTVITNTATTAIGNIALLPNQVITQFTGVINDPNIDTTATQFQVTDATGILVGASFIFNSDIITDTYTVLSIDSNKIETQLYDAADLSSDPVEAWPDMIFTNPRFVGQPELLNLITDQPASISGAAGDLRGQVYANSSSLYVAFSDYQNNTTNWAKFDAAGSSGAGSGATPAVSSNDTTLATTAFVHDILPYGTIIMWYSTYASIPIGWSLCNGSNGTPNLVNMFIRGAGTTGAGTTGGTADAVVVSHSHTGSTNDAGSHTHYFGDQGQFPTSNDPDGPVNRIVGDNPTGGSAPTASLKAVKYLDDAGVHNHTVTTTLTGESGTNKNLPPYYTLCYIMKTSGA